MDLLRVFAPIVVPLLALVALLFWWKWRGERKEERTHADALAALADALGGRVVDAAGARAWTTDLLPPLRNQAEGVVNRVGTVRRARFETALDFRRGGWSVRVSESSIVKHGVTTPSSTIHEHRIEVATSPLPATRLCRRVRSGFQGRPLPPAQAGDVGPAGEPPVTAVREQRDWLPVRLPEPADLEFTAFSTDPVAVSRAFTPQLAQWLVDEAGLNPFQGPVPVLLTIEGGYAYTTAAERIDPERLLARVDLILSLLSRIGATPAHPPAVV